MSMPRENSAIDLDQLRLALDEFHQLRDVYISCFEACCKAVRYLMAFINTATRGGPEKFTLTLPPKLANRGVRRAPSKNFIQFSRLPNFEKLAYVYEWPALDQGLNTTLDNKLRNYLGHNSVRHDLRTGMIINGTEIVMSYLSSPSLSTVSIRHCSL